MLCPALNRRCVPKMDMNGRVGRVIAHPIEPLYDLR